MVRNSGARTLTCPHCSERYLRTNYMIRRIDGRTTDTHLIGCAKRTAALARDGSSERE